MPYGTVNADVIQSSVSGVSLGAGNSSIMKNRIINGAMVIDQRNAGASVNLNANGVYSVDRFRAGQVAQTWGSGVVAAQQQVDAPAGFYNSVKLTVSTADSSLASTDGYGFIQQIEANNLYDLNWGTADAKTVTLSFWVKSSLTGTFAGSLVHNGATAATNYSYVYTYSIPVANTWTYITVTVPGQTTANTPSTGTSAGTSVVFDLGSGSNVQTTANTWTSGTYSRTSGSVNWISNSGATLYLTGVQLEVGSSATGFEYRQYTTELQLCQRYYYQNTAGLGEIIVGGIATAGVQTAWTSLNNVVTMRATPTSVLVGTWDATNTYALAIAAATKNAIRLSVNSSAAGQFYAYTQTAPNGYTLSAEL